MYARFDLLLRETQFQNEEYLAMLEFINNEKE